MKGILEDPVQIAAVVLLIIVVIGGAYVLSQKGAAPVNPPAANTSTALSDENAKVLLNSFDKLSGITSYQLSFGQEADSLKETMTIVSKGGNRLLVMQTPYDERRAYFHGNESYVCEKLGDADMYCAPTANSTSLKDYADGVQSYFLDADATRNNKKIDSFLISKGALTFSGKPEQRVINGIACTQVKYNINYAGVTISDLAQINMRPDDPVVAIYKNYSYVECIENKTGAPAYLSLSYIAEGKTQIFERTANELSTEPTLSLDVPVSLSTRRKTEAALDSAYSTGSGLINCAKKNISERDQCYYSLAFSTKTASFCEYVKGTQKHGQCYIAAMSYDQDPVLCTKAVGMADDCYIALAVGAFNKSYCYDIKNASLTETCLGAVNESAKPKPPEIECTKDSDCKRAGCSGQFCQRVSEPGDIVSNCKYQSIFDCYTFTTCGCYEGKCGWDQTDNYLDCVDKVENGEWTSMVQNEFSNLTNGTNSSSAKTNSTAAAGNSTNSSKPA